MVTDIQDIQEDNVFCYGGTVYSFPLTLHIFYCTFLREEGGGNPYLGWSLPFSTQPKGRHKTNQSLVITLLHTLLCVCVEGGGDPFQGQGLVFQQLDWQLWFGWN